MTLYSPEGGSKVTAEFLIRNPRTCPPHVVILGAGASIQAFPEGDNNRVQLPSMVNLVELTGLREWLNTVGIGQQETNFEAIYSRLFSDSEQRVCLQEAEEKIRRYFSSMQLPETPTLYDHLLLSLRKQDLVATFNWDPLLFDAWERLDDQFGRAFLPQIAYLHGNVRVGYCPKHMVYGRNGRYCLDCDELLSATPLLFPIETKNYESDPYISDAWQKLRDGLDRALAVTIFGYGAPASDSAAISAMKTAWNDTGERELETIFMIDIKSESDLLKTWRPFIFSHHYNIQRNFYESQLPRTARRSVEALMARTLEGRFVEQCPIPGDAGWEQLRKWFHAMVAFEPKPQKRELI